jgi:hypothetical protein
MSFIDEKTAASFSAEMESYFDYFSREFIVFKEPIKVLVQPQSPNLFGYGSSSNAENYTYIPVTGIFKGRVEYTINKGNVDAVNPELKVIFAKGDMMLITKKPARDFILNGNTIKIEADEKTFNIISQDIPRPYLNNIYYAFILEQTK